VNVDEDDLPTTSKPNPSVKKFNEGRVESDVRDVMDAGEDEQITKTTTDMVVPPVPTVQQSGWVPKLSAAGATMQGIPHHSMMDQVHTEI